ncbi:membrane progestin receptor alpha-like [Mytilus californianus]|uniref:membrane progestin receptor alpha-like n=1 Tax=Mytilus californianus TaxID=6549 RepID=UPI0022460EDA|nr:membrane progestin receptor alpha-like [Mytilus californianus]
MDLAKGFATSGVKIASELWKPQRTLHVSNIPPCFREPGILKGYRLTNQNWFYYAKSIFYIHNETFNIWTHLIAFFILWSTLARYALIYDFWTDDRSWPILVFGICCLVSTALSTLAHIWHSKSRNIHYTVFLFDYVGASLYGFGSGILALYTFSDDKTYKTVEVPTFILIWFYAWFDCLTMCGTKVFLDENSMKRKCSIVGVFILYGFVVTIPVGHRYWTCYKDINCSLTSLNHISVLYLMFVLQGFTFGSHLPELLFPGVFDILGQSHQWFHIVSTATQMLQIHTAHFEISHRQSNHGNPDLNFLILATLLLAIFQTLSLLIIRRFVPNKDKRE